MKLLLSLFFILLCGSCFSQDTNNTKPINLVESYSRGYDYFCYNPVGAERAKREIPDSIKNQVESLNLATIGSVNKYYEGNDNIDSISFIEMEIESLVNQILLLKRDSTISLNSTYNGLYRIHMNSKTTYPAVRHEITWEYFNELFELDSNNMYDYFRVYTGYENLSYLHIDSYGDGEFLIFSTCGMGQGNSFYAWSYSFIYRRKSIGTKPKLN